MTIIVAFGARISFPPPRINLSATRSSNPPTANNDSRRRSDL
jgi:hypothetical protein